MSKISQAEARRFRAEANKLREHLRQMHKTWGQEYPGGVCIGSMSPDAATVAKVQTAGMLGHAVVVTRYGGTLYFHALPAAEASK